MADFDSSASSDSSTSDLDMKNYYSFTLWDFAVFITMLAASSGIGIYFAYKNRKNHSNKEFLTSNKSLSLFPVAMSLLASFQSSVTILGYPAEMFYRGTQFWMVILSSLAASMIAAELFLPVFYRLNFTSVNQYLEQRFNSSRVRLAVSFSFLLCTVPYMGVVLYGPSLALETVTGLSVTASILIIGCICTLYTSIGGIKAVVWTDVVQVFLMFAGLFVVMFRGFYLAGGIEKAFETSRKYGRLQFFNSEINIYSTTTFWNCVIGMGTMWSGNYATSQTEVQRYCNVTTQRKAKLSLYVNFLGVAFLISCACLCGVALFGVYYDCDPLKTGAITKTDQLMPHFVMNHLRHLPGMAGLFVSCVFSASLSTMSSGFNALATVTYDDFISRTSVRKLPEKQIQQISKLIAFGYGMAAIAMAFVVSQINSILEAAISIAGALVGPMFGLFLCGILVPFANSFGVLCGLFVGEFFGLWILIGSLLYPKPAQILNNTSIECPTISFGDHHYHHHHLNVSNLISPDTYLMFPLTTTTATTTTTVSSIPLSDEREGMMKLYHISYLLVPVFGCIISLSLSIICSLISGGHRQIAQIRPEYLSHLAWKIWPQKLLPTKYPYDISNDQNHNHHQQQQQQQTPSITNSLSLISNGTATAIITDKLSNKSDSNNNSNTNDPTIYLQSNGNKYPKYNTTSMDKNTTTINANNQSITAISIVDEFEYENCKNRPQQSSTTKSKNLVKQIAIDESSP